MLEQFVSKETVQIDEELEKLQQRSVFLETDHIVLHQSVTSIISVYLGLKARRNFQKKKRKYIENLIELKNEVKKHLEID